MVSTEDRIVNYYIFLQDYKKLTEKRVFESGSSEEISYFKGKLNMINLILHHMYVDHEILLSTIKE